MPKYHKNISLTEFQKQVAIGMLLGDGSLSLGKPNSINWNMSCYHAIAQKDWLVQEHAWLIPAVGKIQWCAYLDKRSGKAPPGGRFHTWALPDFTELAKMFGLPGKKRVTPEVIKAINHPVALVCLIGDDGSWARGINIATKDFTEEENERLARHFTDAWGLTTTLQSGGKYAWFRITADSVVRVRELCSSYLSPSVIHKLGPPGYKPDWRYVHSMGSRGMRKFVPKSSFDFI